MHIFLLLFLFLQLPSLPHDMMTPQAKLARAEQVIKEKQKSAEQAVTQEGNAATLQVTWHQQGIARNKEKLDLIEKVKISNHLDSTWTWDDATSKFVQKN